MCLVCNFRDEDVNIVIAHQKRADKQHYGGHYLVDLQRLIRSGRKRIPSRFRAEAEYSDDTDAECTVDTELGGFTLDNPPDETEDRLKLEDELREEGDLRSEQDEDGAAYVVLGASAEFSDLNGSETSIEADNIIELKDVTDEIEVKAMLMNRCCVRTLIVV